jgi:hypothetical protein
VVDLLPDVLETSFTLREVQFHEVVSEIKQLRSDCSCGPDKIPVKFIKMVPDKLASPLMHIINNCISAKLFPLAWKIARISPIPMYKEIKSNDDFRPISILPVLSKVYERLVLRQMAAFMNKEDGVLKDLVSAYRKGHTTTSVLLAMKDDILHGMKKGEVTMAVLADFSKAFDTVDTFSIKEITSLLAFLNPFCYGSLII